MKLVLLVLVIISVSLFGKTTTKKDSRLCKIFQEKIIDYKKKMRHDAYAQTTLESYRKRAKIYCTK